MLAGLCRIERAMQNDSHAPKCPGAALAPVLRSGAMAEEANSAALSGGSEPAPARRSRAKAPRRAGTGDGLTPMLAQFLAIKRDHADCLLFYRMGDFYELFFDDAVKAAEALAITLTKRGKHEGRDIPMCGVPVHAADGYLARLIRQGFRVAVCEQTEDPAQARKRGAKSVVRREVVRLVTPGTLTEDSLLDARASNYLVALARAEGQYALAWTDMSTGEFSVMPVSPRALASELARLDPGEIVLSEAVLATPDLFELFGDRQAALSPQPAGLFDSQAGERRLKELYGVAALDAFGAFGRAELAAAGALVEYIGLTQKGKLPRLGRPRRLGAGATMSIDAATRRNLELTERMSGGRGGSLLEVIDRTVTGAGARRLLAWLSAPLTAVAAINERLEQVAFFVDQTAARESLRAALRRCPDIERALSRLTIGRGGPRDLAAVRAALAEVPAVRAALAPAADQTADLAAAPPGVVRLLGALGQHQVLVERLSRALVPSPGLLARDGGFIATGYNDALDELVTLRDESRRLTAGLEARYRASTGIASLKVRHNNVLGYYVEVTPTHADKVAEPFIHRQTLASAVRFTTVELGELESKINSAADKALALELALFDDLVGEVGARAEEIAQTARALSALDVAAALAEIAVERDYCRPVVDDSLAFDIVAGRHPVVEALAQRLDGEVFVPNDSGLGEQARIWLVTGPNMAGKSTFLRQNALIAVLAQIGAYVPAERAHIGVVDRLFSRVGAADDLARGRSTFMVEMIETAAILHQAGTRALVILDEIGRGTATFDGLSIAWATVERLHERNRCRALFATHYHELTALGHKLDALACYTMRVKEWQGKVVFLHEVAPGAADRSYGIHVARLAGLPDDVLARAEQILEILEKGEQSGVLARLADDLPLFAARGGTAGVGVAGTGPAPEPVVEALEAVNADELIPRDALDLVYRLKALARRSLD